MQKRHCAESVHGHCIVDRFGQVWSCSFDISARIATKLHTRTKNLPGKRFLSPFWSARFIRRGGNSPSSCFNWHKVWTGVKCNFSSAQLHDRYIVRKLSISRVRMWNFTRIRRKTKKFWLSKIPAQKAVVCDHPQKGVNYYLSSPQLDKPYVVGKLSISEA